MDLLSVMIHLVSDLKAECGLKVVWKEVREMANEVEVVEWEVEVVEWEVVVSHSLPLLELQSLAPTFTMRSMVLILTPSRMKAKAWMCA